MIDFIRSLLANPTFAALGGASLLGAIFYALRQVPSTLLEFLQWRFTCRLIIFNEDSAYEKVNEWLAGLDYAKRCRQMRLSTQFDNDAQEDIDVLSPGLGKHFFWYRGRPVLVERSLPDKGGIGGWKRFEDITISTVGSDSSVLRHLVDEVREARKHAHLSTINVFLYRNRWRLACRKPKRPLETVVLPAAQKSFLLDDIKRFLTSRQWYQERGVPWRRGYMLEGEPGTGKTSLVLAIASELQRPVYSLNLGSIANDDELIDAVCEVPEHGILLIEDIDAAKAGAKRDNKPKEVPTLLGESGPVEEREISLSALLNVIDGAFSREGRLLFMTSNHPEKVDPALLRPGRSDRRITIGKLEATEVWTMAERFVTPEQAGDIVDSLDLAKRLPIPAAELQEMLVQLRGAA